MYEPIIFDPQQAVEALMFFRSKRRFLVCLSTFDRLFPHMSCYSGGRFHSDFTCISPADLASLAKIKEPTYNLYLNEMLGGGYLLHYWSRGKSYFSITEKALWAMKFEEFLILSFPGRVEKLGPICEKLLRIDSEVLDAIARGDDNLYAIHKLIR